MKNYPVVHANLDAERAVISSLLLNDENYELIKEIVDQEDFYFHPHQLIFDAIKRGIVEHGRVDLIVIEDRLKSLGMLERAGGMHYLEALQDDIPSIGMIKPYAKIVRDLSEIRGNRAPKDL